MRGFQGNGGREGGAEEEEEERRRDQTLFPPLLCVAAVMLRDLQKLWHGALALTEKKKKKKAQVYFVNRLWEVMLYEKEDFPPGAPQN